MGGYTRFDKDMPSDPRIMESAEHLYTLLDIQLAERTQDSLAEEFPGVSVDFSSTDARDLVCNALVGGLVHLWTYADTYINSDDSLPLSSGALARVMRLPQWCIHLYPADWLVIDEDNERVLLPGFCQKTGIKPRDIRKADRELQRQKWAEDKRRQRRSRKAVSSASDNGKTSQRHLKDTGVDTPPLPGTGSRSPNHIPGPVPMGAAPLAAGRGAAASPRKSFEEDFSQRFGASPPKADA